MNYIIRENETVKVNESSGAIQNIGQYEIKLSSNENFSDFFVLSEMQTAFFNKPFYVKIRDSINPRAEFNIVTFITSGGGSASSTTTDTATIDTVDDYIDNIFSGGDDNYNDPDTSNYIDNIFNGGDDGYTDNDFEGYIDDIYGG